jgi:ubiquinone/menaquinone biosynthesis C-methylase UbiE
MQTGPQLRVDLGTISPGLQPLRVAFVTEYDRRMTQRSQMDEGHRWFAAFYAAQSKLSERGKMVQLRRDLLAGLSGDVIEIGAGTGANFAHYPPEARVIACEPDPYMLERAEATLVELGATNIGVRREAAERLPFDDGTFDAAVSTLVLCTVRDPRQALRELQRVLKPGSELRFMEHVRGGSVLGRVQDVVQPAWGWFAAGCHLTRDTESLIREAGFEITSIKHGRLAPPMPMIRGVAVRT